MTLKIHQNYFDGKKDLVLVFQILDPQEYEMWRLKHLVAENSMEGQEKKLFDSACNIEMDLELLGNHNCVVFLWWY